MGVVDTGTIFFLYSAFLLSMSCIVYFLSHKRNGRVQSAVFLVVLINLMLTSVFAIMDESFRGMHFSRNSIGYILLYGCEMGYFILHAMLAPLYMLYVLLVNGVAVRRNKTFFAAVFFPLFLVESIILLNPISHVIFKLSEDIVFTRGPLEVSIYVIAAFYLVVSFYYVLRYRKALTDEIFHAILYFALVVIAGIVIQLLFSNLKVELFAEALALMGSMLAIEVDNGLVDPILGVFNRSAFVQENQKLVNTGHEYLVATINLSNYRFYSRNLGAGVSQELQQQVLDALKEIDVRGDVFKLGSENLAMIVFEEEDKNAEYLENALREVFERTWMVRGMRVHFSAVIHIARVPEDVSDLSGILDMADREFQPGAPGAQILTGKQLEYIRKENTIENYIRKALEEDLFEVFYQPIYDVDSDSILAAEALLRLRVPEEGFIPPDRLIPVAEDTGLIVEIGNTVLRKVCAFIKDYDIHYYGMKYVEVNLSLLQCLRGEVAADFSGILKEYGVRPEEINLEITESADTGTSQIFHENLQKLRDLGFHFSLDDYGTGYSNLSNIIHMDYVNIKCDKSILWDAAESEKTKSLLVDTIHTMRNLGMNLIQEGVETEEQLRLVTEAGCNRIQGYYFSKALPPGEFMEYLRTFDQEKKNRPTSD